MDAHFNRLHSTAAHGQKRRRRHNGNGARTTTKVTVPFVVVRELQSKIAEDLITTYGLVVIGVEAHIVAVNGALAIAVACVGAVTPAVDMPMQDNGATCLAVPAEHG